MIPASNRRRAVLLALLVAPLPFVARAAEPAPRVIAVLSLIGDEFQVVGRRASVGSGIDRNDRHQVSIEDPVLDESASKAAERALKEATPSVQRLRVSIRDPRLYALQDALLEPGSASDGMRQAVQDMLQLEKATHLLLVTKRRDDAKFKVEDGTTGAGKVAGVGIYLDNTIRLRDSETFRSGTGYYASFAYVKVTMIDIATMRPIGSRNGADSVLTASNQSIDAANAWDVLPTARKVDHLVRVIDTAVYRSTLELASAR